MELSHTSGEEDDDLMQYFAFMDEDDEEAEQLKIMKRILPIFSPDDDEPSSDSIINLPKRKRTCRQHYLEYIGVDGQIKILTPTDTFWYIYYVLNGNNLTGRSLVKFRSRFRMPYDQFISLLSDLENHILFNRWKTGRTDRTGRAVSPLPLLLLGALRYLGRAWTFDDIEEATAIDQETHRQFFHVFILYGSTELYDKHIQMPQTASAAATHISIMAQAGFAGCIGSTDATHISMNRCAHSLRRLHTGYKLPYPSRTYNLTCDHRRYILHTTSGHPASWNDKTLQRFDTVMCDLQQGKLLDDVQFILYDTDEDGEVVEVLYQGAWLIVDNGYMSCSTAVPPMKKAFTTEELRWSKWVESMRKDVECTFGILKKRFAVLKTPIRLQGVVNVDRTWKTCCALHNMLHGIDNLDCYWGGIECSPLDFDIDGPEVPAAVQTLRSTQQFPTSQPDDYSGMGNGNDLVDNIHADTNQDVGSTDVSTTEVNIVRNLSQATFRSKLVTHLNILFEQNKLVWPKRSPAA